MKIKLPPTALALLILAAAAFAQTVTITPKKTVYRRPKPIMKFKRTFSIRRPLAKAATPAISKAITAAISPEKILEINMKDELGEYQWLEEADYKVIFNRDGILCVNLWMTGTAAYPDSVERYVTVSSADAHVLKSGELFSNLPALAAAVRKKQRVEIKASSDEMKKDPENADVHPEQLFEEAKFTVAELNSFFIDAAGVTFVYDYGFPHVLTALEPGGQYHMSWNELKPFIKRGGLLARFVR